MTTTDIIIENYNSLCTHCARFIADLINDNGKWNDRDECVVNLSNRNGGSLISFNIDNITYVVRSLFMTIDDEIKIYCMFYDNNINIDYETEILFSTLSLDNKVKIIKELNKHYKKLLNGESNQTFN